MTYPKDPIPYGVEPDLRDAQHDIACQMRLDRAFERELDTLIFRLQRKRQGVIIHRESLNLTYLKIERTLCPITICPSRRAPRKNGSKPLTEAQTLTQLAKLCGSEMAQLVKGMLKEGRDA